MKKTLSVLLVLAMMISVCFAFASCGNSGNETKSTTTTAKGSEAQTTAASASKDFKIGVILLHDEDSTYDNNFIQGVKDAQKSLGLADSQVIIKKNIGEDNGCYDAASELVAEGCNVVFADSFGHESYILKAAKEFTNVQFCHATGTMAHTEKLANFHNAFASIYEGRYLAGIAAGMKLNEMIEAGEFAAEDAKIGYVGAYTYAEVISGYTSFFLGVKSEYENVKMYVQFTGSWYDETKESAAAKTLLSKGCALISQHADSMGAPSACEDAGVPNVSYNGSTKDSCPNTFIVSSRINWAPYFEYLYNQITTGAAIADDYTGTIATGSVVLTEVNEAAAAAGTQDRIDAVKAELQNGTRNVFDASKFTVGGVNLTSYKADVDTDAAYTPDTEVIDNGVFYESKFRSAPYFDIRIDDIELLNELY